MKLSEVRAVLEGADIFPDELVLSRGVFFFRRGFFYTGGESSEKYADEIKAAIPAAEILNYQDVWKPFIGGAPVKRQSHFLIKFRVR